VLLGVLALVSARTAREGAAALRETPQAADVPYAPSPAAARYLSLGYHELAADLFLARLLPYFGGEGSTPEGVTALVEAIVAFDPKLKRAYDWGARAMTLDIGKGVDRDISLRAIRVLEIGAKHFPDDWRIPYHAGQIYLADLETKDPVLRREWDEKGALLLEAAIRKPNAPAEAAASAAFLRTRLGQRERAFEGLQEMLLITTDLKARKKIIDEMAALGGADTDEIVAELLEARRQFEREWKEQRPAVPPGMYVQIGSRARPGFDLADLATGGRDLVGSEPFERLDPPEDP
jgi:hypothetical protein